MTTSEAPARHVPGLDARRRAQGVAVPSWHVALPGVLAACLAFASGGFFPGQVGAAAAVLAVALLLRLTVGDDPLEGWSPGAAAGWRSRRPCSRAGRCCRAPSGPDAPARALYEFDRALLYLLAFGVLWPASRGGPSGLATVLGVGPRGHRSSLPPPRLPRGCSPASSRRVPGASLARLAHPLTYWNALSVLCALGLVLAVHAASGEREPPPACGCWPGAAIPILVVAGYFPLSRSGIATALVGLLALRGAGAAAPAADRAAPAGPPAAAALVSAYGAEALATATLLRASGAGRGPGGDVVVLVVAVAAAALLRAARAAARARAWTRCRRPGRGRASSGTVAAGVLALAAIGGGGGWRSTAASGSASQYDAFVRGNVVDAGDWRPRERLRGRQQRPRRRLARRARHVRRRAAARRPAPARSGSPGSASGPRATAGHRRPLAVPRGARRARGRRRWCCLLAGARWRSSAGAARGLRGPDRQPTRPLLAAGVALLAARRRRLGLGDAGAVRSGASPPAGVARGAGRAALRPRAAAPGARAGRARLPRARGHAGAARDLAVSRSTRPCGRSSAATARGAIDGALGQPRRAAVRAPSRSSCSATATCAAGEAELARQRDARPRAARPGQLAVRVRARRSRRRCAGRTRGRRAARARLNPREPLARELAARAARRRAPRAVAPAPPRRAPASRSRV